MPVGLQTFRDDAGVLVQLDADNPIVSFIGKYTISLNTAFSFTPIGGSPTTYYTGTFTIPAGVLYPTLLQGPGAFQWDWSSDGTQITYIATSSTTLDLWLFGIPTASASSGVGLELYTASGQLAFDGSRKPLIPHYIKPNFTNDDIFAVGEFSTNEGITIPFTPSGNFAFGVLGRTGFREYRPVSSPSTFYRLRLVVGETILSPDGYKVFAADNLFQFVDLPGHTAMNVPFIVIDTDDY